VEPGAVSKLKLASFSDPSAAEDSSVPPLSVGENVAVSPIQDKDNAPFILSEALPVVPARLAKRIVRGDYVDMAELLKDNMEVERRRWAQETESSSSHLSGQRVSRREIPDMLSWLQCFSLYAAVVCSKFPDKVREMWAYQAIMIAEQRRCGGRGWLLYDSGFRQQVASFESVDFSKINQSLYSTTFLAYGGRGQCCTTCMAPDHTREECALHPGRAIPVVRVREPATTTETHLRMLEPRKKRMRRGACYAWNDGKCSAANCQYEHKCSRCLGDHRRPMCRYMYHSTTFP